MNQPNIRVSRHTVMMIVCCFVPMAALASIFVFKLPASQTLRYALILLCPLTHVAMMAFMGKEHAHSDPPGSVSSPQGGEKVSSGHAGPACH
jgi:hypothetical protein